ncbi:MAG: DUF1343 domain-containing protein [Bacteroidota bacterium]
MKFSYANVIDFKSLKYTKVLFLLAVLLVSCKTPFKRPENKVEETVVIEDPTPVKPTEVGKDKEIREEEVDFKNPPAPLLGIERLHLFLDSLKNKEIAVVGNQTSLVKETHLVDTLIGMGLSVCKVFSPEHGFRGEADAGEKVNSSVDEKTGIPLISLYGNNRKPTAEQLDEIDIVIYDIQDVGVRFYTYISTLHYVMEACAENGKQLIVLDRPNPNGHYIDGPVLEPKHRSFVGMHSVPIVYGMTIGEYAMMINGEKWLRSGLACNLWVIPCKNYNHKLSYVLPVAPSPNLKSDIAIIAYPSLCLFEATTVSVGRGTDKPFEIYGHPNFPKTDFQFTPVSMIGAKTPPYENQLCNGFDLVQNYKQRKYELDLSYLIKAMNLLGDSSVFINQSGFFDRLAGTSSLREQLKMGWSAKEIRHTWQKDLDAFKKTRKKYLLYP